MATLSSFRNNESEYENHFMSLLSSRNGHNSNNNIKKNLKKCSAKRFCSIKNGLICGAF